MKAFSPKWRLLKMFDRSLPPEVSRTVLTDQVTKQKACNICMYRKYPFITTTGASCCSQAKSD